MTSGAVVPDEATFVAQAQGRRVVPVTRRLLADGETPVGVYTKLAGGPGTFLLESAEQGAGSRRLVAVFVRRASAAPRPWSSGTGRPPGWATPPAGVPLDGDPVAALRETVAALAAPTEPAGADLPPLTGGMVGYLSYDLVRRFERLPATAADDVPLPELGMMLATDLVVLDHFDGSAILVANAVLAEDADDDAKRAAYHQAVGRLDAMTTALSRPTPPMISTVERVPPGERGQPHPAGRLPEGGRAGQGGDPGRRVLPDRGRRSGSSGPPTRTRWTSTGCCARPTPARTCICCASTTSTSSARRRRRTSRSAPRRAACAGRCCTRSPAPAGAAPPPSRTTRWPPSCSPTRRNAPSTSCWSTWAATTWAGCAGPGTVEVPDFARIERYSHVMHIVSTVVGELRDDRTRLRRAGRDVPGGHALRRAQGPRHGDHRGAGADPARPLRRHGRLLRLRRRHGHGDRDPHRAACRAASPTSGAGAGIVADSDPASEEQETRNKAAAVLAAIAAAETLRAAR